MTTYAEGDRIYATEDIDYLDMIVPAGHEGTVAQLTGDDRTDLFIEWDFGITGGADSAGIAVASGVER